MKVINYMNFVRQCEPRSADFEGAKKALYDTMVREFEIAKKYDIPCTFLLQYDAVIDDKYVDFFKKNADGKTEIGLWYELPKQLLDSVGLEWRGKEGWTWDWHIVPGFSMAYTQKEREMLIDSAMGKFREKFGFFPRSVASWLIDTHTVNYLNEKYDVDYIAICRDQTSTDAYTLVGGFFNGAYYPSKFNVFTPAQTPGNAVSSPVFRLLGPDPVHNYDNHKYVASEDCAVLYTLEPAWTSARRQDVVEWYNKSLFENESLNFAYAQIGQENSFFEVGEKMFDALEMQIKTFLKNDGVRFMTTGETGKLFRKTFSSTPAECVYASEDWSSREKVQSLIYNCSKYTANLFRFENRVFFRNVFLFDEKIKEKYLDVPCETWDATYENLPVCDTHLWKDNEGLTLDCNAQKFEVRKDGENTITAVWKDRSVTLGENCIEMKNVTPVLDMTSAGADVKIDGNKLVFTKDGVEYGLTVIGAEMTKTENSVEFTGDEIEFVF